jgi:predicted nucleic acid-binding protein
MIDAFVVDASVAIAWIHPAQATAESAEWLSHVASGAELVVPSLWPLEVANALLVLERRRKLTAGHRREALRLLGTMPVALDHDGLSRAFGDLSDLAHRESLSLYDASYLEVAIRRALPLSCKDGPLRAAATRHNVGVTPLR